jgi:hypothetical protein
MQYIISVIAQSSYWVCYVKKNHLMLFPLRIIRNVCVHGLNKIEMLQLVACTVNTCPSTVEVLFAEFLKSCAILYATGSGSLSKRDVMVFGVRAYNEVMKNESLQS